MRGKVEVFAVHSDGSQSLVASEDNLVVNGAGESIVDMLTTPSSVLGIAPRVMDTSNWRFGALSFGPAKGSFSGNAYFFPEEISGKRVYWKDDDLCNGVSADVTSWFNQVCTDHKMRVQWVSGTIGEVHGATASSYTPPYRLPSYPDPLDQKLEDAHTSYSIVSGDGTRSYGQFENRINFTSWDASSYFQGAYPYYTDIPSDLTEDTSAMLVSSYVGDFQGDTSANMIVFDTARGIYNQKHAMDYRGFIETTYNASDMLDQDAWTGRVYVSGSTENSLTGTVSQCSQPTVTAFTKIYQDDAWSMNLYGGLHQIGLWNMDTPRTLLAASAPFEWIDPDVPNPNKLMYTVDTALDPDITFNTDLAGTWSSWGTPPRISTFSGVEYTNPFGGVSSLIWSGMNDSPSDWGAMEQHPTYNPRLPKFGAASSICMSVYVKEYDDPTKAANSFGINIYDYVDPVFNSYANWFEFQGGVPVQQGSDTTGETTKIEDVGDGWYRCSMSVAGLGAGDPPTKEGDLMRAIFYFGSQVAASTRNGIANKLMYWYAPQVEQHTTVGAPALPTPYQGVRLQYPDLSEEGNSKGITPQEFKLFAKKSFTDNLTAIKDSGATAGFQSYAALIIKWTLDLRSQHD